MAEQSYVYIIIGAGLAGASAIEGIRQHDKNKRVLLVGREKFLPYDRPPLSKKLWSGQQQVKDIFLHPRGFYEDSGIDLLLDCRITEIDRRHKLIRDEKGTQYRYEKLLLATGGRPRRLDVPGGELEGVCYYRYLGDYLEIRRQAGRGKSAVVIGGGFIGSEIAAALKMNNTDVTMVFPEKYICSRVFPDYLGESMQERYTQRGIKVLNEDRPVSLAKKADKFITRTQNSGEIVSDMVIVGIGIAPDIQLAEAAGLKTGNGIVVNDRLQTSDPDIYAAGDNAFFPYPLSGKLMRIEHWDNAVKQGKLAGMNMAEVNQVFRDLPYFFSDLFEFGYEAVGEIDAKMPAFADWQEENSKGVIYYLSERRVKGIMLCNVWKKARIAQEVIRKNEEIEAKSLRGLIG
ncbi:MAG: NAD(P)/FAD-dependent oxidoreductase [Candidatus Omnitrophica bacterium]|nr:NAD(P)/FAD-dependent oxidoreductase [Candidatus Omnitrophota bacterium]